MNMQVGRQEQSIQEGWRFCLDREEWSQIHEPGVDLLVWKRELPEALVKSLEGVDWDELPGGRCSLQVDGIREMLSQRLGGLSSMAPALRERWQEDIAQVMEHYCQIMDLSSLRVRLDKVDSDGCRRFHIDNMSVRLLCTYIGPATEWLPSTSIERREGQKDHYDHSCIKSLPHLSVCLLKGRKHPTHRGTIYHRSPPIAAAGLRRFVLCLDGPH